ncbi:MAG: putative toxin-antitoxin system toxin component, PIN family [Okeania sp. SIO2G4]|uniref:putative toxin-antitoxin system toxin component, PIN family n=1 Tax=unclassified Okeania TaxID=2634635 RepID=UPI0013BC80EF|nr:MULTISPECIES: putative toxin-antitoxin system toxin component, PIN family [unclassified Okeania]NEP38281.1 putative toxin-antitoxin system toxin component, PIN family [Okeania sp. SIO2H7]NEP73728.1 putative toxin-antitoxin system toxin component, PIN family [Okeania sp. SIO2G5]NEP95830.1 putative toxin-antitoxin system toxin component, PIN family [Okeania sp. SIO2F5]NEQ92255.1 putative toxin-antitoxin system toxin component, PIN family [Okeania sp. SIO2G4]
MNKLRLVIDTNILVSSILIESSLPDIAFKEARKIGTILFSDVTFQELQEVLTRSKFDKYIPLDIRSQFLAKIKLESEQILVSEIVNKCRDPKDDKFLDVAVNGQATHIITGDKDLLELNPFQGIPILTPKQFLEFIKDIKP